MTVDASPIALLVSACIQDLQATALKLHHIESGNSDADLVEQFKTIESELCSALQVLIDRSIDDSGLTAW